MVATNHETKQQHNDAIDYCPKRRLDILTSSEHMDTTSVMLFRVRVRRAQTLPLVRRVLSTVVYLVY